MKQAAIYARVSTRGQKEEGSSLETQVEAMEAWAQDHDYSVDYVFREDYSGTQLNRPLLDQVKELAQAGEIDVLLVYSWDRLSRDADQQAFLRCKFEFEWGVEVINVTEPEGMGEIEKLALRMAHGIGAQLGNYQRREATIRGKRAKALAGEVIGSNPAPYGYEYTHAERRDKKVRVGLEVSKEEATTVHRIFKWYIENGLSISKITKTLTEKRVPTAADDPERNIRKKAPPGVWNRASVRRILTNPVYDGRWYYAGIEVPVPRIVPPELWEAAQERLRDNRDRYGATSKYDYLLTGMIYCKTCGKYRIGTSSTPGSRLYRYYVCPNARNGCDSKAIPADKAERYAWLLVLHFLRRPTVIHRWLVRRKESTEDANAPLIGQLELLDQREQQLNQEAKRWEILFIKGRKSETELDKETEKIEREKADIRENKEHLRQTLMHPVPEDYINNLVDYFRKAREMLGVDEGPDVRDDWPETSDRDRWYVASIENGTVVPDLDGAFPKLPDSVRNRLESLVFEEKRALLQSIGLSIFTNDYGQFTAFSIYPEQGFRAIDKSLTRLHKDPKQMAFPVVIPVSALVYH